jgi:ligand-binding SRPBCC domain-containing protein
MRLILDTKVKQDIAQVARGFNQQLFEALAPPFPKLNLKRFDGCETGDIVSMELDFGVARQKWVSKITDHGSSDSTWFFIDEGMELPKPLIYWRHRHLLTALPGGGTKITDHAVYRTGSSLLDKLIYPGILGQFLYRKPIYKKQFS